MPLRIPRAIKRVAVAFAITVAVIGAAYYYAITPHRPSPPPQSDESFLFQADTLSWGNRWEDALPLYGGAQQLFLSQHNASKALYAEVSEILPDESISIRQPILRLPRDLATPEAQDPETKLRVLTIRGMLDVNYDAAEARSTWQEVKTLALKLHHVAVATRAQGEQGIAAFLLEDTDTAKKLVLRAWGLSTALSIYEMQLIPAPRRCSLTEKKFARGVKKRLPQAAYIVDAQNRDILERVELERDSAFQYGRLLLDAGRGAFRCPRHSVKKNRCWFSLAAIRLADLVPVPRCSILINGFESLPAQEERPRWQTTVSKRSFAHALRLGSD